MAAEEGFKIQDNQFKIYCFGLLVIQGQNQ